MNNGTLKYVDVTERERVGIEVTRDYNSQIIPASDMKGKMSMKIVDVEQTTCRSSAASAILRQFMRG